MTQGKNGKQRVLEFLQLGGKHTAQEIANAVGLYVNTTDKWIAELRNEYDIASEFVVGKRYKWHEYLGVKKTYEAGEFKKKCEEVLYTYPAEHNQYTKIKLQIEAI